ncbi:hypothetical protein QZH41_000429 [Actinostola sp. cb2023]|nr:hypothetical protein QZH41_000429 [Actinostola sp. cb2023]
MLSKGWGRRKEKRREMNVNKDLRGEEDEEREEEGNSRKNPSLRYLYPYSVMADEQIPVLAAVEQAQALRSHPNQVYKYLLRIQTMVLSDNLRLEAKKRLLKISVKDGVKTLASRLRQDDKRREMSGKDDTQIDEEEYYGSPTAGHVLTFEERRELHKMEMEKLQMQREMEMERERAVLERLAMERELKREERESTERNSQTKPVVKSPSVVFIVVTQGDHRKPKLCNVRVYAPGGVLRGFLQRTGIKQLKSYVEFYHRLKAMCRTYKEGVYYSLSDLQRFTLYVYEKLSEQAPERYIDPETFLKHAENYLTRVKEVWEWQNEKGKEHQRNYRKNEQIKSSTDYL